MFAGKRKRSRSTQNMEESSDIFLSQPGPSTQSNTLSQESARRSQRNKSSNLCLSQPDPNTRSNVLSWQGSGRRIRSGTLSQESDSNIQASVLSQGFDPSVRANRSSQRYTKNSNRDMESENSQNVDGDQAPVISSIIKYLLVADGNKQVVQKNHIIKNVLNGNHKLFRSTIEEVKIQLFAVFLFFFTYYL